LKICYKYITDLLHINTTNFCNFASKTLLEKEEKQSSPCIHRDGEAPASCTPPVNAGAKIDYEVYCCLNASSLLLLLLLVANMSVPGGDHVCSWR
jgi:hypothetical protein